MKLFKISLIVFFLFSTCCASLTRGQSFRSFSSSLKPDFLLLSCPGAEKRDNEFTYNGEPNGNFYCNPLMLGGVAFDYNAFTLESEGELKLIKGGPKNGEIVEIPFYLHLRRNGMLVTHTFGEDVIFSKVEISTILKFAQAGDELIFEPANKEDWPAKRIMKIGDRC
jgi:hypothetical protein